MDFIACYSNVCRPTLFVIMQPLLNLAQRAARAGAEVILRSLGRLDSLDVSSKGRNDFVSEVDRAAEREIIDTIKKLYPDHAFLAEESGLSGNPASEVRWIVDPLDGTTNFLHGFPTFAVSIAAEVRGRLEAAVVLDVMRQEFFTASRGAGAQLEGKKIRVSKQLTLEGALIATGFPYRSEAEYLDSYLAMLKAIMQKAAGVRRPGSAALDLAWLAAGRVDGFWEIGLKAWDTAAGTLLIQEAGGLVGTLTGAPYTQGGNIIAAPAKLFKEMVQLIAPLTPANLRETDVGSVI
jgi:myo-inositol-1(or 4)-monophosphatase